MSRTPTDTPPLTSPKNKRKKRKKVTKWRKVGEHPEQNKKKWLPAIPATIMNWKTNN